MKEDPREYDKEKLPWRAAPSVVVSVLKMMRARSHGSADN
jgi:hypothetical protein